MGTPWWRPKNATEEEMAAALRRGDAAAYFRAVAAGVLYLPRYEEDESGEHPALTRQFGDETAVPVYTSLEGLNAILAEEADTYTTIRYPELRARWPAPRWRLAINYGHPISAYLPVTAVAQVVSGDLLVVDNRLVPAGGTEPIAGVRPVFDPRAAELLELAPRELDQGLSALRHAAVLVPTRWQIDYPDDLFEPDFPLLVTDWAGGATIEAFTSTEGLAAAYPDLPYVSVPFPVLMALLPDRVGLVIDPGGGAERELRDAPLALLMLHLAEHREPDTDRLLESVTGAPAPGRGGEAAGA